jgi:hypothetical protein
MNRFFSTLATAAGVILLTGTFAAAQTATAQSTEKASKTEKSQTAKSAKTPTASGAIVKSDATSVTIKTAKGEESFALSTDTKITQGQKTLKTADLAAGEKATISYTKAGEQMTATKIKVAAKAAPKSEKAPKTEPKK